MHEKSQLSHSVANTRNLKIMKRHLLKLFFNQIFCRVGYVSLPSQTTNEHTKQYQFNVGLRKGFIQHLFARNSRDIEKVSRPNVALSHFHEKVVLLNAKHLHGSQFIKNSNAELGLTIGMYGVDIINGPKVYYALPSQSMSMAEIFIGSKEVARFESGLEMLSPTRISSTSKRALREAELLIETTKAANLISENKKKQ